MHRNQIDNTAALVVVLRLVARPFQQQQSMYQLLNLREFVQNYLFDLGLNQLYIVEMYRQNVV